jgi:hypothetical protein
MRCESCSPQQTQCHKDRGHFDEHVDSLGVAWPNPADGNMMTRLLIVAERNWQVAEDEGSEHREDLLLFRDVRDRLGLPRTGPGFR